MAKEIQLVINAVSNIDKRMNDAEKSIKKMETQTDKSTKKMESSFKSLQTAIKLVVANAMIKATVDYTKSAEKTALSLEILKTKSKDVYDQLENTSEATLGLASRYDMVTAANKALAFGIDLSNGKFETLMKMTTKLSAVMGISAAQAFDDLTTATGRQSKMIADNLGIVLKMQEVYAKEAKALGVTTKALTNQQKQRAFLNEIIKQGQKSTSQVTDKMIKDNTKLSRSYKLVGEVVSDMGQTFTELLGFGLDYWVKQMEDVTGLTQATKDLNAVTERYAAWQAVLTGELDWITKVSGIEERRNQLLASNIAYKKKLDNEEKTNKYIAKLRRKAREKEIKAEKAKNKKISENRLSYFTSKRDNILNDIISQEKEIDNYNDLSRTEKIKKDKEYAEFKKNNSQKINSDQRDAALQALEEMRIQNASELDERDALDQKVEALAEKAENRYQNRLKMMSELSELGNSIYQKIYDKAEKQQKEAKEKERALSQKHFNILKQYSSDYLEAIMSGNADAIPKILAQQAMMFGQEIFWDGLKTFWFGTSENAMFPGLGTSTTTIGIAEMGIGAGLMATGGIASNALSSAPSSSSGSKERNNESNGTKTVNMNVVTSLYGSKTEAKRELHNLM